MTISFRILLAILCVMVVSCTAPQEDNKEAPEQIETIESNSALDFPPVELKNGVRWAANAETTEGIENMIGIVNSFEQTNEVKAYSSLADELNAEFLLIFQKCTMKGEAHNQLHNYLLPMRIYLKRLESDNPKLCNTSLADLREHLDLYSEYFE